MLSKSVVLLVIAGIAVATAAAVSKLDGIEFPHNPRYESLAPRIVGGNDAAPGQFPYAASVRVLGVFHICGGAIITDRWVVTAGVCTVGWSADYLDVTVGAHLTSGDGVDHLLSQMIVHPEFEDDSQLVLYNDIALLQTQNVIIFGPNVAIIPIRQTFTGAGESAHYVGWGVSSIFGDQPDVLQYIDVVTLTNLDCQSRHPFWSPLIHEESICAYGNAIGRGTCFGDTGNPLVVNGELVGIVSWWLGCAVGRPEGNTRVAMYLDWMEEIIGEDL